jgi:hypothetical protein
VRSHPGDRKSTPRTVCGLIENGPLEPMQPPMTFEQMTK